jgi:hypothetical protein
MLCTELTSSACESVSRGCKKMLDGGVDSSDSLDETEPDIFNFACPSVSN